MLRGGPWAAFAGHNIGEIFHAHDRGLLRPRRAGRRPAVALMNVTQGGVAEVVVIEGDGGHLEGVLNVAKQGDAIRAFLAK